MDESYIYIAHAYMIYKLSQPIQSWFDSGMLYKIAGTPLRYPKAQLLDMKNFFFFLRVEISFYSIELVDWSRKRGWFLFEKSIEVASGRYS